MPWPPLHRPSSAAIGRSAGAPRPAWGRRGFVLWCVAGCAQALAQPDSQPIENQVKAAFLYKFGSYVEWPAQSFERPDSPFVIGVLEDDAFARVLEQTVAGRNMNGHPVQVQLLRRGDARRNVHILYIPRTEAEALGDAIAATKGQPVLTVTDAERGLGWGCMIAFVVEQNKVRFDIAPEPADQSRLKISARLMSVARKVVGRVPSS